MRLLMAEHQEKNTGRSTYNGCCRKALNFENLVWLPEWLPKTRTTLKNWWAVRDLNPRPPARHAGALAN